MPSTPERFVWAADLMEVKSSDHVLEIGCGVGLLAEIVADKIQSGSVTGIDKSASMIAKARKRNQKHVKRQVVDLITSEFLEVKLPPSHFDIVVAFNVNFFLKKSSKELKLLHTALKKEGKLYVFYQAPFDITISAAEPIKSQLLNNDFHIVDVQLKKLKPTSSVCVVAKPS